MREALRNRGGAQNVVASVSQAAESEPETGFSGRKDPPMPAQGSAGLDWLDLRAFAPKNLQNVIEKLRTDLQPAVIQKGFSSEAEEVTRLHSHYKDGLGSCSENEDTEVTSAPALSQKGAKGAGRPGPKAKGKAKAVGGLKAALLARGGMQRPAATEPIQISSFEQRGNAADAGGLSPRASSPLASSPLPSVEEDLEAEAADHEAPKEEPDYLVGPVPVVEEAVEEAAAAAEQAAATQGAEEESALQEAATADSADAQNAEGGAAADGADNSQANNAEESNEGVGHETQDAQAKAEEPAQTDKVKKEFAKVVTNTRAEKVNSYDFRVQHFNQPVANSSDGVPAWKASMKRGDLRRAATTPVGEMRKEELEDKERAEECGEGTETPKADPVTICGARFRENKEVPKKLKDLQDFWGKKSVGFAGPSLGGNKRLSKGEAQATLQRLIAAGGAVDFDEVRRLRKLIAELE